MPAAAWWAGSETMLDRGTDNSWAPVPPAASLCNHARSSPPHYDSNLKKGWRGGPRKFSPQPRHLSVRSGKKGRLRCEDDVLNLRKHSSNLPLCGSIKRSAGQSRLSLATAWVINSTSSSYWGEREGAISPAFPMSTFKKLSRNTHSLNSVINELHSEPYHDWTPYFIHTQVITKYFFIINNFLIYNLQYIRGVKSSCITRSREIKTRRDFSSRWKVVSSWVVMSAWWSVRVKLVLKISLPHLNNLCGNILVFRWK